MLKSLNRLMPLAQKIKVRNPTMPILRHLCVKDGMMWLTNLETTVCIPVEDQRSYTLPVDELQTILKTNPKALRITPLEYNRVEAMFDLKSVVLPTYDSDDYPAMPTEKFKKIGAWSKQTLQELNRQTKYVSKDELKPALNGILVRQADHLACCASDAHRLVYLPQIETDEDELLSEFNGIIPPQPLKRVAREARAPVIVYASKQYLKFEFPSKLQLIAGLIEEIYPDFESVIDGEADQEVTLEKRAFLDQVRLADKFANPDTHRGVFRIQNGIIELSTTNREDGIEYQSELRTLSRQGDRLEIGLNLKLLASLLTSLNAKTVRWCYRDPLSSSFFYGDGDDKRVQLLMPIRLEEDENE